MGEGLAVVAPRNRRTAFSRATGNHHGKPLITGAGPEGGLAKPGHTVNSDAPDVDVPIGLEIVEGTAGAPRPGGNRSPFVVCGARLSRFHIQSLDASPLAPDKVRSQVVVFEGGNSDSRGDKLLDSKATRSAVGGGHSTGAA